jgi:hypothetical protein
VHTDEREARTDENGGAHGRTRGVYTSEGGNARIPRGACTPGGGVHTWRGGMHVGGGAHLSLKRHKRAPRGIIEPEGA